MSRLDRSRLLDFKYCPPGVINRAQYSDLSYFCYFQKPQKYKIMRTPKHKRILQKAKSSATNRLRKKAMKNKVMKKTMLDIGGDDTREEVRDLMNESDLSLAGVVRVRFRPRDIILNFQILGLQRAVRGSSN